MSSRDIDQFANHWPLLVKLWATSLQFYSCSFLWLYPSVNWKKLYSSPCSDKLLLNNTSQLAQLQIMTIFRDSTALSLYIWYGSQNIGSTSTIKWRLHGREVCGLHMQEYSLPKTEPKAKKWGLRKKNHVKVSCLHYVTNSKSGIKLYSSLYFSVVSSTAPRCRNICGMTHFGYHYTEEVNELMWNILET